MKVEKNMSKYNYYIRRVLAFFIDWYFNYFIVYAMVVAFNLSETIYRYHILFVMLVVSLIVYVLIPFVNHGQTLGHKVFKLRLLKDDNSYLSLVNYFVRFVFAYMIIGAQFYTFSSYLRTNLFVELFLYFGNFDWLSNITKFIDGAFIVIGFLDLSYCLYNRQQKCFHDYLLGQKVVLDQKDIV